jgi:hypothetical protein
VAASRAAPHEAAASKMHGNWPANHSLLLAWLLLQGEQWYQPEQFMPSTWLSGG